MDEEGRGKCIDHQLMFFDNQWPLVFVHNFTWDGHKEWPGLLQGWHVVCRVCVLKPTLPRQRARVCVVFDVWCLPVITDAAAASAVPFHALTCVWCVWCTAGASSRASCCG